MDLTAFCKYPELRPGIIISFIDKAGKSRTEVIFDRTGDNITVKNALKKETVVSLKSVLGYWEKDAKTTKNNRIMIRK